MVEAERRARMRHRNLKPLVDANGRGMANKARRQSRRSRSVAEKEQPRNSTESILKPRAGSALDWRDSSAPDAFFDKALGFLGPASSVPMSLRSTGGPVRKNSTSTSFAAAPHRPPSSQPQPTTTSWDATTTFGKVLHKINVCVDQNLSGGIVQLIERIFTWHAENCVESASSNEITMPELNGAFLAAGLKNPSSGGAVVTQADLRKLFRALEADGRGKADMDDVRSFLLGEHYSLTASRLPAAKGNQGTAGVYLNAASSKSKPGPAAVERTVWIGGIPEALVGSIDIEILKHLVGKAAAEQFGDVESVNLRPKPGDKSWGFVIFSRPDSAFSAVAKQSFAVEWGGTGWTVNIEPLAMRREMAEEWREGNEAGALPDMWRKTVENTAHGQHLVKLRAALEAKTGGMAHSTFRLFKQFQRKGKQPSSGITLDEFRAEAEALNFNLNPTELEALFADLGGEYDGGISLQMLYQVLMGSDKDLATAVWEQ
jgi:hypothetical protein